MWRFKVSGVAAVVCLSTWAHAEGYPSMVVDNPVGGERPMAYVVDRHDAIVRGPDGQCLRTHEWTAERAQATRLVGSEYPAGCICDKDAMTPGTCDAKPVAEAPVQAAPPPIPAPLVMPPKSDKTSLAADALFDFDSAALTSEGRRRLSELLDRLKLLRLETVVVVGYTDRLGHAAYNQRLSERRARTVKEFMTAHGLDVREVFTEGRGAQDPVTGDRCATGDNSRSSHRALVTCLAPDRRVVIEAVGSPRIVP